MKRINRHKIIHEKPETSTSHAREAQEHDLAYYIHDRVELMHQVFSMLKTKDLKAIAPECVRRLSVDDLQELCTEELLGISSKRLCAILDGADPPSDTESSSQSPEHMETISLDSISSDDEILSQTSSKKKKRKHRRRDSATRRNKRRSADSPPAPEGAERSRASRAGLTVLELLELQARARAIRAQLQNEQAHKQAADAAAGAATPGPSVSDNEVEIKEESPEVVEISSEDEKPSVEQLQQANATTSTEPDRNGKDSSPSKVAEKNRDSNKSKEKKKKKDKEKQKKDKSKEGSSNEMNTSKNDSLTVTAETTDVNKNTSPIIKPDSPKDNQTVTKRINDLIITVPQHHTRKIKLNRNKVIVSVTKDDNSAASAGNSTHTVLTNSDSPEKTVKSTVSVRKTPEKAVKSTILLPEKTKPKEKVRDRSKKKQKKKEVRKSVDSDHDEITLQLSDTEKMDLLEDFDRKHYDNVSSSSSDSESSSETDSENNSAQELQIVVEETPQKVTDLAENFQEVQGTDNTDGKNVKVAVESDSSNMDITETCVEEVTKIIELTSSNEIHANKDHNSNDTSDSSDQSETTEHSAQELNNAVVSQEPNKVEGYISTKNTNDTENVMIISNIEDIPVMEDTDLKTRIGIIEPNEDLAEITSISMVTEEKSMESSSNITAEEKSVENTVVTTDIQENITVSNKIANLEKPSNGNSLKATGLQEKSTSEQRQSEISKENAEQTETAINLEVSELSDGEVSDHESSEVEAFELKPEVVCISDEERQNTTPKKKKKKDKSKKEKKSKKTKSDFCQGADENFYKNVETIEIVTVDKTNKKSETTNNTDVIPLDNDENAEQTETAIHLKVSELSDGEAPKKKKKKDKSKKEKKSKKTKSDFCQGADENFYNNVETIEIVTVDKTNKKSETTNNTDVIPLDNDENAEQTETAINLKVSELSDGEVSDHESSEVEAFELKPEVCISDEERQNTTPKKKKKKDKSKKEKKSKKTKSDFCQGADENFYKNVETIEIVTVDKTNKKLETTNNTDVIPLDNDENAEQTETAINLKVSELSDGEVSDHESSEVEAFELKPEVVCISDEERQNTTPKKKKKKDKKSKKEKKSKKTKSDFCQGANENFNKNVETIEIVTVDKTNKKSETTNNTDVIPLDNDDDVYEILELSDDSSCYEVEGTVLSKEPTAKEINKICWDISHKIAALSAKIDEIELEEVVTDEQIRQHERKQSEKEPIIDENEENPESLENISWKDRYLDSKKVKTVLTTSNILNALRKKNKELKKKLEESKNIEEEVEVEKFIEPVQHTELEEGTIEQYNTLQGSTKYVNLNPVPDPALIKEDTTTPAEENSKENNADDTTTQAMQKSIEIKVTGEMKKDAKQLLKMYRKLLKYNDITRTKQKDPNKKKKKKKKKDKTVASVASV